MALNIIGNMFLSLDDRSVTSPALLVSIQPAFANALRAAHAGLTQPACAAERNNSAPDKGKEIFLISDRKKCQEIKNDRPDKFPPRYNLFC